jgi:hypothetical protein
VRFFRDDPRTTTVRWFFVPEDRPFLPPGNNFVSGTWDSDPKPSYYLGPQPDLPTAWADGSGDPGFNGHICGTDEQWRFGEALPPVVPTLTDPAGFPLCCQFPFMLDMLLWLRPQSLGNYGDDSPIPLWLDSSGHNRHATQSVPSFQPLKSALGAVMRSFASLGGLVVPGFMGWTMPLQHGDFTCYLVGGYGFGINRVGPAVFGRGVGLGMPLVSLPAGVNHASFDGMSPPIPADLLTLPFAICCQREGTLATLTFNGIRLSSFNVNPAPGWAADRIGSSLHPPFPPNTSIQHPITSLVTEVMVWGRALSSSERRAIDQRLHADYGIPLARQTVLTDRLRRRLTDRQGDQLGG